MVEIIPKKTVKLSYWLNILFYLLFILVIFSIAGYFILNHYLKKSQEVILNLEESLTKEETVENIALEAEILNYQKKIKSFSQLKEQHLKNSKIFNFIQKNCHPRVWFSQFNLSPRNALITLSGTADTFETVGQQILIFKEDPIVENIEMQKISIAEKGGVNFSLSFFLNPEIFQFQEEI